MNKRYLLKPALFACLALPLFHAPGTLVHAQISHSEQGPVDREAAAILKKAAQRFGQTVQFTVKLTLLDPQQKATVQPAARVLYDHGRYRLAMEGQEVMSDGKTVWQWNKAAKEVYITNMNTGDDDIDLFNPARLLASYSTSFKAKYIRTETDGTAIVDLQPRSARNYHKIRLFVNQQNGLLHRMEVHRFDSGREIYELSNFKKTSAQPSQFTFNASQHPELEVIDMR